MSFCSPRVKMALTHPSWSSENGGEDYEKLEFLGDAVLQLAVTQLLFDAFPTASEGDLSKMRHRLVNNERLADISNQLQIGTLLRFGKGDISKNGRRNPKILANAFEALLGALYLDLGLGQVRQIVARHFSPLLTEARAQNPKSKLHEWSQKHRKMLPSYEIIQTSGPDHALLFTMSVSIGDDFIAVGKGSSKQMAAKNAAINAVKALGLAE